MGIFGQLKSAAWRNDDWTAMCEQSRQRAYELLIGNARALGANAVVGLRYDSAELGVASGGATTEVVCYGTAVIIEPDIRAPDSVRVSAI